MCHQTAKLVQLDKCKGSIEVGKHADFVVWDPDYTFEVVTDDLHMKNKRTPYEGATLQGHVYATFLRGRKVYEEGEFLSEKPCGRWLHRDRAN